MSGCLNQGPARTEGGRRVTLSLCQGCISRGAARARSTPTSSLRYPGTAAIPALLLRDPGGASGTHGPLACSLVTGEAASQATPVSSPAPCEGPLKGCRLKPANFPLREQVLPSSRQPGQQKTRKDTFPARPSPEPESHSGSYSSGPGPGPSRKGSGG